MVGRIDLRRSADGPLPMCWANGFKALHGKPFVPTFLRRLDRQRERQIRRLERAQIVYGPGSRRPNSRSRAPEPVGYRYSYAAQFHNAGGVKLIKCPYRGSWLERIITEPLYRTCLWVNRKVLERARKWRASTVMTLLSL
jgi:hypothetical protein